jgi:hypothetical protein
MDTWKTLCLPVDDVCLVYHSNSNYGMAVKGLMVKTETHDTCHHLEMQTYLCICDAGFMSLLKAYKISI